MDNHKQGNWEEKRLGRRRDNGKPRRDRSDGEGSGQDYDSPEKYDEERPKRRKDN